MEQGGAFALKGLEAAGAEESCWLQNMKRKVFIVFITCFNKKEGNSMRA